MARRQDAPSVGLEAKPIRPSLHLIVCTPAGTSVAEFVKCPAAATLLVDAFVNSHGVYKQTTLTLVSSGGESLSVHAPAKCLAEEDALRYLQERMRFCFREARSWQDLLREVRRAGAGSLLLADETTRRRLAHPPLSEAARASADLAVTVVFASRGFDVQDQVLSACRQIGIRFYKHAAVGGPSSGVAYVNILHSAGLLAPALDDVVPRTQQAAAARTVKSFPSCPTVSSSGGSLKSSGATWASKTPAKPTVEATSEAVEAATDDRNAAEAAATEKGRIREAASEQRAETHSELSETAATTETAATDTDVYQASSGLDLPRMPEDAKQSDSSEPQISTASETHKLIPESTLARQEHTEDADPERISVATQDIAELHDSEVSTPATPQVAKLSDSDLKETESELSCATPGKMLGSEPAKDADATKSSPGKDAPKRSWADIVRSPTKAKGLQALADSAVSTAVPSESSEALEEASKEGEEEKRVEKPNLPEIKSLDESPTAPSPPSDTPSTVLSGMFTPSEVSELEHGRNAEKVDQRTQPLAEPSWSEVSTEANKEASLEGPASSLDRLSTTSSTREEEPEELLVAKIQEDDISNTAALEEPAAPEATDLKKPSWADIARRAVAPT